MKLLLENILLRKITRKYKGKWFNMRKTSFC